QAAGERAVAHYRDDLELLALQIARRGDPERGREARAGVPGAELVVGTLVAPQEPRQAARLTQRRQALVATGEDLPRVALVANVPHDPAARGDEAVAQSDRHLDHTPPGAHEAPGLVHDI